MASKQVDISDVDKLAAEVDTLKIDETTVAATEETTTETPEETSVPLSPRHVPKDNECKTIEDFVFHLRNSMNIVIVTGAGISTSCGIPDFRSSGGLYDIIRKRYPDMSDPTDFFNIRYFKKDPMPFFLMAKEIWPDNFEPSRTHKFMAKLDNEGKLRRNYTQNIDTLEQQAGMKNVIQCHGSFHKAKCQKCGEIYDGGHIKEDVFAKRIPKCKLKKKKRNGGEMECDGVIKPEIVFFGEGLPKEFFKALQDDECDVDLIIVIGSTMKVSPVCNIPQYLGSKGVPMVLINCESVGKFDLELLGYCDDIVDELEHMMQDENSSRLVECEERKEDFGKSEYFKDGHKYYFKGWREYE